MPINIGKSQILLTQRKGSFFLYFCSVFGIGKSTARWALANTGLPVSAMYSAVYAPGPFSREYIINKLFYLHKDLPYFVFGRELKHLRFVRKKKFLASTLLKALRMRGGLPIMGQRTHSNARTSRRLNRF